MTAPDDLVDRLRNSLGTNSPWNWELCGQAADELTRLRERVAELEAENAERAEIIENHREARKAAEAELADRRSHDAERQQEWFVTQKRAERAEAERDALRADAERLNRHILAMATELLDLRGSFPAQKHEHLYAAIDAARKEKP